MITLEELQTALKEALKPTFLELEDRSALHHGHKGNPGGLGVTHLKVHISAPQFENKSPVLLHRAIYQALAPYLAKSLHAVEIQDCL